MDKDHFQRYGWIISRNHLELLKEAENVIAIVEHDQKIRKGVISGNYLQINCLEKRAPPNLKKWVQPFFPKLEAQVKHVLNTIGVPQEEIEGGELHHLKLLIAPAHSPLRQSAHRDGYNKSVYVVAFYLTNHDSTHFSLHPYPSQDLKSLSVEEMRKIPLHYWTEFISKRCSAGDMSIFKEDVIHAGPNNLSPTPRYVLFSVFKPKTHRHSDYSQFYAWDFIEQITFFGSDEHRKCLLDNITRRPFAHYSGPKKRKLQAICNSEKRKQTKKNNKLINS